MNKLGKIRLSIFATLLSYIVAGLKRITFKFDDFTSFKALFSLKSMDFPQLVHVKVEKTVEGSILTLPCG